MKRDLITSLQDTIRRLKEGLRVQTNSPAGQMNYTTLQMTHQTILRSTPTWETRSRSTSIITLITIRYDILTRMGTTRKIRFPQRPQV